MGGARHLTDWGAIADVMVFAVRKPVWTAWSEGEQAAARQTASQAIAEAGALAREDAAVRQLAANGVSVVRITAAGHEAFRAAVESVSARWREAIGGGVVVLAERAVAATRPAQK
jgi:TRAP-type C4-dicarboxylate transport system substrate-binding protein